MYSTILSKIRGNLSSGIAVALINIPLSLALAVASLGNYPQAPLAGILTAIWAGLTAAIFASSKQNIYGPAGALSGILLAFSIEHGAQYVPILAIVSGFLICLVSVFGLAKYLTLIPSSALHGFLLGVGITIAGSQLNNALGLNIASSKEFAEGIFHTFQYLGNTNLFAFGIFIFSFVFLIIWKRKKIALPGALPITIIGIIIGYASMKGWIPNIDRIETKFPNLTFQIGLLPDFKSLFPTFFQFGEKTLWRDIFATSSVIAIVAILETLIAAKIAEGMTKMPFNKDQETKGLGIANIISGIFGGLPATAVLVRTALNAKSGAKSRTSALIAAIGTLILAGIAFGFFKYLPMPVIAAILMSIAVGMIEIPLYKRIFETDKFAFFVTMLTGILTVFDDPLVAILTATSLSLLVFLKKVSDGNIRISLFKNGKYEAKIRLRDYLKIQGNTDTVICKLNGSLTYLNTESTLEQIMKIEKTKHMIISFSNAHNIDLDGLEAIEKILHHFEEKKIPLYISGCTPILEKQLQKIPFFISLKTHGKVFENSSLALQYTQ